RGLLTQNLSERTRRRAKEDGTGSVAVVAHSRFAEDAGLTAENNAGADVDVIADADLPGDDRAIAHAAGTGDAGEGDEDDIFADVAVVADVHEVVNLGSPA